MFLGTQSAAQEHVTAPNAALPDRDFYRLIACAAPQGGDCQLRNVRWPENDARDLTIKIVDIAPGYPLRLRTPMRRALYQAQTEINKHATGLKIRHATKNVPSDINIYLVSRAGGPTLEGKTHPALKRMTVGNAFFQFWIDENDDIKDAAIVFLNSLPKHQIRYIAFEELIQATGLSTGIDNPWHTDRSIFSDNTITQLQPQDVMALRRHYPVE